MSTNLVKSSFESSNSRLMHLSLPKVIDAGHERDMEQENAEIKTCQPAPEKDEVVTNFDLTKEEPPDHMIKSHTMATPKTELNESSNQVSNHPLKFVSKDYNCVMLNLLCQEEFEEKLVPMETNINHIAYLKTHVIEKIDEIIQTEYCFSIFKIPMTIIMHLSLVKIGENISATEEKQREHEPEHEPLKINGDKKCENGVFTKTTTLLPKAFIKPERGVIAFFLIKEEPPDVPRITKPQTQEGKALSSQKRMKANLLSLRAGYTVSRSKLFQEGEYDEDIKSSSTMEQIIRRHGEESMEPRRATETYELCSAKMKIKNNRTSSTVTWDIYSTHLQFTTKKNQLKSFPQEEIIEDSIQQTPKEPEEDQRLLNGGFRPNQEELDQEPTCSRKLTHQRVTSSWNQVQINFGLEDIQFLNQRFLSLPYLEGHGFVNLQTHTWRPGEALNHPGETLNQSGETEHTLPYTIIHRIRRIPLFTNLPYQDMFTLGVKDHQRLYPFCSSNFSVDSLNQDVPRHQTFMAKLSRLKHNSSFLISSDFLIIVQRPYFLNVDCFSFDYS